MTVARTMSLALISALAGMLSVASARAQTVASSASGSQSASLSVSPAPQDYVAAPVKAVVSPAVRPTDPVKLAAFQVIETHCARCHETDRLIGRAKPAKGFGNILHLDDVAANSKYVKPGDPDRSLLYHVIIRQEMPSDVFSDGDLSQPTPTKQDLQALRNWIEGLGTKPAAVAAAKPADWQALHQAGPDGRGDPSQRSNAAIVLPAPSGGSPTGKQPSIEVASLAHPDETLPASAGRWAQPGNGTANVSLPNDHDLVARTQDRLKALGCFDGAVNGIRDSSTDAALARYNTKLGRGTAVAALTPDLLDELISQTGRICAPVCPVGWSADGFQCVPDATPRQVDKPRQVEKHREPADVGTRDDEPVRHKRPKNPPAEVAHARPPVHERPVERAAKPAPQRSRVAHGGESNLRRPSHMAQQRSAPAARESSQSSASSSVSNVNGI